MAERLYPEMKRDIYISGMNTTVERFFILSVLLSLVLSIIFLMPIALILFLLKKSIILAVAAIPFLWVFMFLIVLRVPRFNVLSMGKKIEAEIAVTGRRLLIHLESGKSLVNSLLDMSKGRDSGHALERVAYELYMGKPLEIVIEETIENSPSHTFKKLFIQIHNSLRTGSDLKQTVKATLEDITRKKIVEFETFGKKLSPLGLFYMIFGTIAPSLGIVVFVLLLTFMGVPIKFATLAVFLIMIILVQLFFIALFSRMRPELEI
jgi:Flp pilus assembly protein TadB